MKYSAFISYRRIGGAEKAELLKAVLCKKGYRAKDIFMDTYTMHTGNYVQSIEQAIAQSKNFIVIITKGCFDNLDVDGIWVHELKLAKDLGLNIIPVYFDGIRKLEPSDLPTPISDLPLDNAVIYSHDYADASYERICSFMVGPKHINWQQLIRNNIVSIITICVAAVLLLLTNIYKHGPNTKVNNEKAEPINSVNFTDELLMQNVEFNTILSIFIEASGSNYFIDWASFAKIPGFIMVSDHVEPLKREDEDTYSSIMGLSYNLYLTVNGKNIHENRFGERQLCELNLYGFRNGINMAEINIRYGLSEEEFKDSEIDKYIKMMFPDYQIESEIHKVGFDSYTYKIRNEVYVGVVFEAIAASSGEWRFYISQAPDYINHVFEKQSQYYRSHFYDN